MTATNVRRRHRAFAAGLATVAMALGAAAIPAEAALPAPYDYVALGDSYAAGQGAGPYTDPGCQVSRKGYPVISDRLRDVQLTANAGCSGYTTAAVMAHLPASIGGAEVVTITAGGNDLDTTGVLLACLPDPSSLQCGGAVAAAGTKLADGSLATSLGTMVVAVRSQAPNAKIVLTGYPNLFAAGHPYAGVVNPMVNGLNQVIAGVALNTRSSYVDVTQPFAGHEIGSAEPWINFNVANVLDPANFHPNSDGYRQGYYGALITQGALNLN